MTSSSHLAGLLRPIAPWMVLVFMLVLPGLVGTLSSVVAIVAAMAFAAPALLRPGAWAEVRREPATMTFLFCFVVLTMIFVVTAGEPLDLRFIGNFLAFLFAPIVFLMAREAPAEDAVLIFFLSLVGVGAAAVLAIAGVTVLDLPRAQGLFGGPNLLPRVAIPLGFIAMAGALVVPGRYRLPFYLGPVLAIVVALLAASRGAALALPALGLLAAGALILKRPRDLIPLVLLAVASVALVWWLAPSETMRLVSTASSISDVLGGGPSNDFPTAERQGMLAAGWSAFLNAPLVGHGWANLGTAAAEADPVGYALQHRQVFMFHNDFLDFAVAGGVVGIAVYLLLLAAPILGALRVPDDGLKPVRLYCALVLSVSFAIFGLTDMTLGYDLTTTFYAFVTALLLGMRAPATSSAAGPASRP